MSQQAGKSGATKTSGVVYPIERRTTRKDGSGNLSGYAIDITIRVNGGESYFLQDHNSDNKNDPL